MSFAATAPALPKSPTTRSRPANDGSKLPPATVGPFSLRIAAAKGDASAQFEVASRLAEGKGLDQDLKEAVAVVPALGSQRLSPWHSSASARLV